MSSNVSSFTIASQQTVICLGIPIMTIGVIGGILNLIVFLSLKTFRQSSCAFYLIIMSSVNIAQLLNGNLSRIMIAGFNTDWTQTSVFYCKFRWFFIQLCTLTSYACMCFATIDQYLATSSRVRWQQWSNIKLAHRLGVSSFICTIIHGIPAIIYYNQGNSPVTFQPTCTITNTIYQLYRTYGYFIVIAGILPVFITVLFGSLAYRNVQQLSYRTVPLVRRELDKQLTSMVLVQVVYSFIIIVPYTIVVIITASVNLKNDQDFAFKLQFAEYVTGTVYYAYFAAPFYIYICVSKRFRQQLIYVFSRIYANCCRQPPMINNQVLPQLDNN